MSHDAPAYAPASTIYTLCSNEVERGYAGFNLSVRPFVRPSVFGRSCLLCIFNNNRGILSYPCILSSNFRRCAVNKVFWKISQFENLACFKFVIWLVWLGIWYESIIIMGWLRYYQNTGVLIAVVFNVPNQIIAKWYGKCSCIFKVPSTCCTIS